MLEKNALNEYCDVELCGNATYKKEGICKIIDGSMTLNVVGKLQQVVACCLVCVCMAIVLPVSCMKGSEII
eukprot:6287267-Ditylum_brightwellii.AAC.2